MNDDDVKILLDRLLARYADLRKERDQMRVLLDSEGRFAIALAIRYLADVIARRA